MKRAEIWWADLDPVVGHEQGRIRPVLIVSKDVHLQLPSSLVGVVPLSRADRGFPSHVRIEPPEANLLVVSYAMTEQFRAVRRLRFGRRLGAIEPGTMASIEQRLRWLYGL